MSVNNIISPLSSLGEGAKGIRFDVKNSNGEQIPAFAVCFDGQYFAYLNRCGHIAVQLDFLPGEFFSDDGQTLVCSTHGAEYAPDTGACLGGPCYGIGLEPIEVQIDGDNLLLNDESLHLVPKGHE